MATNAGDADGIDIALITSLHRPENIVGIEGVDILVHQDDVLQLRIGGKGGQGRLALSSLVGGIGLFKLHDGQKLAAAGSVGIHIQQAPRHGIFDETENARFCRNAGQNDMLFARPDAGLHDRLCSIK